MRKIAFCVLLGLLVLVPLSSSGLRAQGSRFDGRWWHSASDDEQTYFLEDYLDCYAFEFKGPKFPYGHSYEAMQGFVSRFYEENPQAKDKRVVDVLLHLKPKDLSKQGGDGVNYGPHFGNGGSIWA